MSCIQRIEQLLKEKGISRNKMSEDIGIGNSTFYTWQKRGTVPKGEILQKIAQYLDTTTDYLLGNDEEPQQKTASPRESLEEAVMRVGMEIPSMIPILGTIHAGTSIFCEENFDGYIPSMQKHAEDYFALRIIGDCMTGAGIKPGSIVTFRKQPFAETGDIVAVLDDNGEVFCRRFALKSGEVILSPENPDYEPIIMSAREFDVDSGRARILGVATEVTIKL